MNVFTGVAESSRLSWAAVSCLRSNILGGRRDSKYWRCMMLDLVQSGQKFLPQRKSCSIQAVRGIQVLNFLYFPRIRRKLWWSEVKKRGHRPLYFLPAPTIRQEKLWGRTQTSEQNSCCSCLIFSCPTKWEWIIRNKSATIRFSKVRNKTCRTRLTHTTE